MCVNGCVWVYACFGTNALAVGATNSHQMGMWHDARDNAKFNNSSQNHSHYILRRRQATKCIYAVPMGPYCVAMRINKAENCLRLSECRKKNFYINHRRMLFVALAIHRRIWAQMMMAYEFSTSTPVNQTWSLKSHTRNIVAENFIE